MAHNIGCSTETNTAIISSYNGLAVHEKMIKDRIRTGSYMDALEKNPELLQGKVVLDVGCGTGILSFFAARAGAEHVYAVDMSDMIENAKALAISNGFGDTITFLKGRVEDLDLPKVDIIVSEWQGFCLLSEFNLDCVINARDRALKHGGIMMPNQCSLHLAGVQDATMRQSKIDYWDDVYGFDFGQLKASALRTGYLATPDLSSIVTDTADILHLDLQSLSSTEEALNQGIVFELVAAKNNTIIHAFLAWFDYKFTFGKHRVHTSTGPLSPTTHWKQTMFLLERPVTLQRGDKVKGSILLEQVERDLSLRFEYRTDIDKQATMGQYLVNCME